MWAHQPSPESSQQLYLVLKVMVGIAKSTTTPGHMTTLYTMGLTKGFHSPHRKPPGKRPNPSADQPREQCSHPPPPCPRSAVHLISNGNPCLTHHPRKSLCNAPPNPRHDRDSEATQCTRPDHRPGGHQPSNHPCVYVRSQWTPSRHDLKPAPLAGWEINLSWTATVPRYNLKPAL